VDEAVAGAVPEDGAVPVDDAGAEPLAAAGGGGGGGAFI